MERALPHGGDSVVLKCAREPFHHEDRILRHLAEQGLPVARVLSSSHADATLTMLLEDLGPELRSPTLAEAATAAVGIHSTQGPEGLIRLDGTALSVSLRHIEAHATELAQDDRWVANAQLTRVLDALVPFVDKFSASELLAPWGLCHSEFHPSSIHVGVARFGILDLARAFHGPQLLDLASYAGTRQPPDIAACRRLLDAYVAAGGDSRALVQREGLASERWALFWHRIWVAGVFTEDALTWVRGRDELVTYQRAVIRHLREALELVS